MTHPTWRIDTDFPGGNVVVERSEGDTIYIRPDLRDTNGHWFYWCFRVQGQAGRRLQVRFTIPKCLTSRGVCVSEDEGCHWQWRDAAIRSDGESFEHLFTSDAPVRFAMAIPYTQADLDNWLKRQGACRGLEVDTLCLSEAGRDVELLRLGTSPAKAQYRAVVIARQHCCESLASFHLEGLLEAVLADDAPGRFLRERMSWLIVPFMDKDGVEAGDQGKNRRPHDHNRDWMEGRYAAVRAVRQQVDALISHGGLDVALDLHCPWLRGPYNEDIYIVGSPGPAAWRQQQRLGRCLAEVNDSPLPYDPANDLPHGQAWNTGSDPVTFGRWASQTVGAPLSATLEFPYAIATGVTVTAPAARAFGRCLGKAIHRYYTSLPQ